MGHDKGQLADLLRQLGEKAEGEIADRLGATALMLEMEHRQEQRREEIANQDTVECTLCHGLRVYFDQGHIPCPRCRGWGREVPAR